jgi:hypothetical protein
MMCRSRSSDRVDVINIFLVVQMATSAVKLSSVTNGSTESSAIVDHVKGHWQSDRRRPDRCSESWPAMISRRLSDSVNWFRETFLQAEQDGHMILVQIFRIVG